MTFSMQRKISSFNSAIEDFIAEVCLDDDSERLVRMQNKTESCANAYLLNMGINQDTVDQIADACRTQRDEEGPNLTVVCSATDSAALGEQVRQCSRKQMTERGLDVLVTVQTLNNPVRVMQKSLDFFDCLTDAIKTTKSTRTDNNITIRAKRSSSWNLSPHSALKTSSNLALNFA